MQNDDDGNDFVSQKKKSFQLIKDEKRHVRAGLDGDVSSSLHFSKPPGNFQLSL
jgi:hypothetical protein